MTPQVQAKQLVDKFSFKLLDHDFDTTITAGTECAIICVEEIINELSDYGQQSMELQNMDRTINYWNEVLTILKPTP